MKKIKLYKILFLLLLTAPAISIGQEYFQQRADYSIKVKLNDVTHELSAFETIDYTNNSPDTLSFLYFHLWPNGYKNNSTALATQLLHTNQLDFYEAPDSSLGFIDSLDFKVNDETVEWKYVKDTIDICILYLKKKLHPGKTIQITTPFRVKIPGKAFSRLGRYKQSYQVTQWYPKPAVYDIYGWHQFPYLNGGEFYSEFGKFDVSITVPENYTVAATGVLQTEEEIERINKLVLETSSITTFNKNEIEIPPSSTKHKTIRFVQDSIHDFAWFADKRFHVLKGSVELPNSHRKVDTWVYFTNLEGNLWKNAINYVNNGVYYYSKWVGDYPYSQCTAVESALGAGGGMEYPMITNIGSSGNAGSLEEVIVHEVGHNWFYGILGSNEREFPWLDEGINSFYEQRYSEELKKSGGIYGDLNSLSKLFGKKNISPFDINRLACEYIMRNGSDQALGLHSEAFVFENYGIVAYMKGAQITNLLKNYLGSDKFDECMQNYFDKWKFKHPYPDDLHNILENCSGKNLDWLFKGVCNKAVSSDYKIRKVSSTKSPESFNLLIKNKGLLPSPLNLTFYKNDTITESVWFDGFTGLKNISYNTKPFNKVVIDPDGYTIEKKRTNNILHTNGLFKRTEPLRISFLGILENPKKTQLCFTPVIGWNTSDGVLPGILLYNTFLPERKMQYRIMPMFGTTSNEFSGIGYTEYNYYPDAFNLQKLSTFAEYNRFHTGQDSLLSAWQKFESGIKFIFKRNGAFPKRQWHSVIKTTYASDLYDESVMNLFVHGSINFKDHSKKFPSAFEFHAESGPDFVKSWLDCTWGVNYKERKTGFSARLFVGTFLFNNSHYGVYNFHLSGINGNTDYTFSEAFPDRSGLTSNKKIWQHQFIRNEGGFGIYTPIQTNSWMTALNLKAAFPVPVPLSLYANIATYKGASTAWEGSTAYPWEMGIELTVIPDIFVIYFPVKMSDDVKKTNELYTTTYTEKIRFTLRLSKLVPFKYTNQLPLMF